MVENVENYVEVKKNIVSGTIGTLSSLSSLYSNGARHLKITSKLEGSREKLDNMIQEKDDKQPGNLNCNFVKKE